MLLLLTIVVVVAYNEFAEPRFLVQYLIDTLESRIPIIEEISF